MTNNGNKTVFHISYLNADYAVLWHKKFICISIGCEIYWKGLNEETFMKRLHTEVWLGLRNKQGMVGHQRLAMTGSYKAQGSHKRKT